MGLFDFILGTREDRFAKRAMARLRRRGCDGPLSHVRDRFALESGDNTYFLGRIFTDWLTYAKSDREAALDEALHSLFEPAVSGEYEEVAHLLTPLVRSRHDLAGGGRETAALPTRRLPGSMFVAVAYDMPHTIQYIDERELGRLGGHSTSFWIAPWQTRKPSRLAT